MHFMGITNTQQHKGIFTCTSWKLLTLNSTKAFQKSKNQNFLNNIAYILFNGSCSASTKFMCVIYFLNGHIQQANFKTALKYSKYTCLFMLRAPIVTCRNNIINNQQLCS